MQFSLAELWSAMGPLAKGVVLVLAGMSLLSFTVAVEKWLSLQRAAKESARFLTAWREALTQKGYTTAAELAEQHPHSHVAHVIASGTRVLQNTVDPTTRFAAYDRTVRRIVLATRATFRKGLGLVATVGSTAPFVGLFGTVVGIVSAFQRMAVTGQGGLGTVSAGIAEALVTTAFGIFVAIPAVWLFNYLTQQINALTTEMECAAEELAVIVLGESTAVETRPLHATKK
ncbi:MAG: MotA/TolQ/ExbB proton channel family protein [Deltaproteobacteria bacterium]|nr:MotA/TolQ/ExbB proton channel family protein [Deltaproteobacteria bacterium]